MMITITHNGFHGITTLRFRGVRDRHPITGEECYRVSYRVAKRLNEAVCGTTECRCGERVADIVPWTSADRADEADGYVPLVTEIAVHYPRR